jgi:hypothetical protein
MPRRNPSAVPATNRLLAALPAGTYRRLEPNLEPVTLDFGHVIETTGSRSRHVYFPTTAVFSMVCALRDGRTAEIGLIGNEGTTAMATCLGADAASAETVVQIAGDALRVRASKLKAEFDRCGTLHDLTLRYLFTLVAQISQSVGCNTHHLLEARLSRWLLLVRDRVPTDELLLRQDFLSDMLGTGRTAVTVAAGALRSEGLIRYSRGKITVLDRPGLEAAACECYATVRAVFDASHRK